MNTVSGRRPGFLSYTPKTIAAGAIAVTMLAGAVQAKDIDLPNTIIWTAYPTGTTGYSQAVGIGAVLQREYGVNLRVIPGRNDISRFEPLRRGRAHFSAGGVETMSAQEGIQDFGSREWGPQAVRTGMWNMSDGCSFTLQVHGDSDIETVQDLKGKRVPYVQGASAPNAGLAYLMGYGDVTWDDVHRVDMGGFQNMMDGFLDNRIDVMWTGCNSAVLHRIGNAPRGVRFLEFPHDNAEAVARVSEQAPWFIPHVSTDVIGMDVGDGIEVFTTPYPMLSVYVDADESMVYNMTKAIHIHYDDYQDSAPGQEGWAMDRQQIETSFVPFHDGAVRYFKELGMWTEAAQTNQDRQIRRQEILLAAWTDYTANAPSDDEEFVTGWMAARYKALNGNNMIPLMESW